MTPRVPPEYEEFRRKQILEAAWDVFAERGYHAATMREIAARLDLSTGVIYNYFKGKEAIVAALHERSLNSNAELFERLAQKETAGEALASLFEEYSACVDLGDSRKHARANLSLVAEALSQEELRSKTCSIYDLIRKALSAIAEAGISRKEVSSAVDPAAFAELMMAVFTGLQVRAALTDDWDYAYYLREAGKMLLGNIWRDSGPSMHPDKGADRA